MGKKYDNCISLGWFCGTAAAMGHCGLRGHSGPFDWYFSDLEPVLKTIETGFSDFMKKENLVVDEHDNKVFCDTKYGFVCNHDIKCDFDAEYEAIYQKYMRRAGYFMRDIKRPTCFIRAVRTDQEIEYIEKNEDYIQKVVKKENPDNEVVFLILKNMKEFPEQSNFLWFRLNLTGYVGYPFEMRTMFEASGSFFQYCKKDILSEETLRRNLEFDRQSMDTDEKICIIINRLHRENRDIMSALYEYYPDIAEGIFIWGAGTYGVPFLLYLLRNGVKVLGIIDNDSAKTGSFYGDVVVRPFDQLMVMDNANIFIAIGSEQLVDEIRAQIAERYAGMRVYSLVDLARHPCTAAII